MDMSTSEEQYSAHYAEYIAESFGVPTAQVLIYDNGKATLSFAGRISC